MKQSYKIYNDFSKGLNTDFNGVNQDPNTIIEMDNFIINNNGTISKRKGLEVESASETNIVLPDLLENKNISTYIWKDVAKQTDNIIVVQVGYKLYFYRYGANIATGKLTTEINLIDYLTSKRLLQEDIRPTFTEVKGVLVCSHKQLSPFYLEYNKGEIKDNRINLSIRDYFGVDDGLSLFERPTTITKEHLYNLYNQGWDSWAAASCFYLCKFYPSNGDVPNHYYSSTTDSRMSGLPVFHRAYQRGSIKKFTKDDDEFALIEKVIDQGYNYMFNPHNTLWDYTNKGRLNDVGNFYGKLNKAYGADLIEFHKISEEVKRTDSEAPKGRVIKNVFDPVDVSNIVRRPITEVADTAINRNKWNDFHIVDNVLDVFYDDVRNEVKLVLELDKEHGLYGGFGETEACVVNAKIGHYDELGQKPMGDGGSYRVFKYELPTLIKELVGINEYKNIEMDEGLWYDTGLGVHTTFTNNFKYNATFKKNFSYLENQEINYYVRNATDNPHAFKSFWYRPIIDIDYGINHTRKTMNEEHLRAKNFSSTYTYSNSNGFPMHKTTLEINTIIPGSKHAYGLVYDYRDKTNASGGFWAGCYNSHDAITYNGTQFDYQQVKRKNVSSPKISDITLKDANCTIEALSTKKCVLVIPIAEFGNKPDNWLFNVSELGELLCFDDIYDSMKIKLSQTLYDKMKKVYEEMKRDEYASDKLDEEYANNPDYYSVKNVCIVQDDEPIKNDSYIPGSVGAYKSENRVTVTVQLNKPHGRIPYAEQPNPNDYQDDVGFIQSDFNKYLSNDAFGSKNLLIPNKFRNFSSLSINTSSSEWGDYRSDYMRHLYVGQIVKLRDKNKLPEYFKDIDLGMVYFNTKAPSTRYYQIAKLCEKGASNMMINSLYLENTRTQITDVKGVVEKNISLFFRYDADLVDKLKEKGWVGAGGLNTGSANFSTTGQPENISLYTLYSYSKRFTSGGYTYRTTVPDGEYPTSLDFIEILKTPMNLNMTKGGRVSLKETMPCQFIGKDYLAFGITPHSMLKYTDADETVTADDDSKEIPLIAERNGNFINTHEIYNMKFSLDGTIPRSEITTKQRAYRKLWTWDMDGVVEGEDEPQDAIELDPDNLLFEEVREEFRPNCTETYSGRVFFGGINSHKYSNTIFYSRQITEDLDNEISQCYTENDPTAKHLNKALPTDGGYININDAGEILGMKIVGSVLCVVASNGVWAIQGNNGYFTATSHSVTKISNLGCISPKSIKVVNNTLTYVSKYSINMLQFNNLNSDLMPADMTKNKVNKLFNSIPLSSKKYLKTVYDSVKGIVYFVYNSKESDSNNPDFNSVLVYNLVKDSFFKFSFDDSDYKIKDCFINEYNHDDDIRLKFICMNDTDIKFFEMSDNNFLDFTDKGYTASLKTSGQISGSPTNVLAGGQVITHLLNKPNTSCLSNVNYDFGNTNKISKQTEIFKDKPNEQIVFNKVMLRGHGNNLNLNYLSPVGKDCEILGFEFNYKVVEK